MKQTRRTVIGSVSAAVAVLALAGAATAEAGTGAVNATDTFSASVRGWARLDWFGTPNNDLQVTVDAHAEYTANSRPFPTDAWGTARIYHRFDDENGNPIGTAWADLRVDCVTVGGPTATITAMAVRTSPDLASWRDKRIGVSIYNAGRGGGQSRVGLSGVTEQNEPLLTPCMAPAATFPTTAGGYRFKETGPVP